jgi:hypothetical protein
LYKVFQTCGKGGVRVAILNDDVAAFVVVYCK